MAEVSCENATLDHGHPDDGQKLRKRTQFRRNVICANEANFTGILRNEPNFMTCAFG